MFERGRSEGIESRKLELTPLIDCIFLLLIFFLVTLRVLPVAREAGRREGVYSLEALTRSDPSSGHALVMLKWLGTPDGQHRTYYVAVTNRSARHPPGQAQHSLYALSTLLCTARTEEDVSREAPFSQLELRFGTAAQDIAEGLRGVPTVIIVAWPDNGHAFTMGEVNEVIKQCRRPESTVTTCYVVPDSSYAGMQTCARRLSFVADNGSCYLEYGPGVRETIAVRPRTQ
jgi:hypothetical protein